MKIKKIIKTFDDNDTLLKSVMIEGTSLKEGWIVMYKNPLKELIMNCKEYSKVRVFFYLSSQQTYDNYVYVSIPAMAKELNMTYKTTWSCVKWLEENNYIERKQVNGMTVFLINPKVTTCGKKSLKEKTDEWNSTHNKSSAMVFKFPDKKIDIETGEIIENE